MKPPIPNSYWVEPGRLLAGEHPDAGDTVRTRARLMKFFAAGVRHFFDLTHPGELPPYAPLLPDGARHYSFAIPDHSVPASDQLMRDILASLAQAQAAGGAVYVHCRAGIGRTGTVVGCWLRERGETADGALDELNRLWQQNARSASWPTVPETDEQYVYVQHWNPRRPAAPAAARAGAIPTLKPAAKPTAKPGVQPARLQAAFRFRGCFAGLAIGDVLGSGAGPTVPGWGDDTAMTLCVAESLLACDGFDGRDQLERFRQWTQDPVAAGAAPGTVLRPAVRDTLTRALRNRAELVGSHDPAVVDPAPLARSAAAALFAAGNVALASSLGADVARVTHQAPLAVDASRLFACMVTAALAGQDKPAVLAVGASLTAMPLKPEVLHVASEWLAPPGGRRSPPPAILGCLDRAARSFARTRDFQAGLDRLKSSPGTDPDATLAAYGALAGAFYGETALPQELRNRVAGLRQLELLADRLFQRTRAAGA